MHATPLDTATAGPPLNTQQQRELGLSLSAAARQPRPGVLAPRPLWVSLDAPPAPAKPASHHSPPDVN